MFNQRQNEHFSLKYCREPKLERERVVSRSNELELTESFCIWAQMVCCWIVIEQQQQIQTSIGLLSDAVSWIALLRNIDVFHIVWTLPGIRDLVHEPVTQSKPQKSFFLWKWSNFILNSKPDLEKICMPCWKFGIFTLNIQFHSKKVWNSNGFSSIFS